MFVVLQGTCRMRAFVAQGISCLHTSPVTVHLGLLISVAKVLPLRAVGILVRLTCRAPGSPQKWSEHRERRCHFSNEWITKQKQSLERKAT